jgi:transposase-like protein
MATSNTSALHFHDEAAAFAFVEARVWPKGPACPHCGSMERIGRLAGKSTRMGVMKCYDCRKPFTVRVGTIFEDSHIALHLWLQAIALVAASKKGISANQLGRVLGITLKSAWFMGHRIRLAMTTNPAGLMGSGGGVVEADETYIGRKWNKRVRPGAGHKEVVFSLVQRGGGVRSVHITGKTFAGIKRSLKANVSKDAVLMTDDARMYKKIAKQFADHKSVNHSAGEYVRGDAHTNTVEGFFSVFKRGMTGVYQHCSSEHLHRYLSEVDFRYNNRIALEIDDKQRADKLLAGVVGKRLTYQTARN